MAAIPTLAPSSSFRDELARRGGEAAGKCMQCATCSSVCELAPEGAPFPRRIIHWAQWGLTDRIAADPAAWLCHQCNDCSERCPRDVRPGDVLSSVRSMAISSLAFPGFLGRMVGNARATWPLLLGLPILFWAVLLAVTGHLAVPAGWDAYEDTVPHMLIYAVFFPTAAFVGLAAFVGGMRFWKLLGSSGQRNGSFLGGLLMTLKEIGTHERFGSCETAKPRRWGHFALLWGFVGAAVTSGLLIVGIYIQKLPMPLALDHPYKLLGNVSAVLLVVGGVLLVAKRMSDPDHTGRSTAFDTFFISVVVLVIATGVAVELARLAGSPAVGIPLYIVHLGVVMTLFLTFPYSKFAHMLYRTLALTHARMTGLIGEKKAA